MIWSKDDVANIIIRSGRELGIGPRGIVIALSVGLVESNLTVYANAKVPGSLALPHDAVGSDGYSVGVQQQQVVKSSGGWWWGDVATCQDPSSSSRLFYGRLKNYDYASAVMNVSAGRIAQAIQGSAFPDRYAERMGEAQELYDRLAGDRGGVVATYFDSDRSGEFSFGESRSLSSIVGICVHTTESGKAATATPATADDVTSYQASSQTGSYHVMVGVDGKRIRQNTDDWVTWSTGNKGNNILLHVCFVGNASQTRAEWLAQDKQLRAAATVVKYWSGKYGIPLKKVSAAGLPGILGHVDTRVWGGTDHTDPGPNFPYDKLIEYAKGAVSAPVENFIDKEAAVAASWLGDRIDKNEIPTPDKRGVYSGFKNGAVYYRWGAPAAYAVPNGGVREAWASRKWEAGPCGFPVARHGVFSWGGNQAFEGGVLFVPFDGPASGVLVHGAIGKAYADSGWESGPYGLPTSDEFAADAYGKGCIAQDFANGRLVYAPSGVVSFLH